MSKTPIALAGIGKIAHDAHVPALSRSDHWELAATISRSGGVDGVTGYHDIDDFLAAGTGIDNVSLCLPPGPRFHYAVRAMQAGLNVMLEKPPAITLTECRHLCRAAEANDVSLFLSWHSRMGRAVDAMADWLTGSEIRSLDIDWREDVRQTHPGQDWIFEPGNLGVFDPGINAMSILAVILKDTPWVTSAEMILPEGRGAPIAAELTLGHPSGVEMPMTLDFRHEGESIWDINVETDRGTAHLRGSGDRLLMDGEDATVEDADEYPHLYDRFAELVRAGESETDLRPMEMVADAFLVGRWRRGEPFDW